MVSWQSASALCTYITCPSNLQSIKAKKKIVWRFNLLVSKSIAVLKIYLFNTEIYIVIILLLFVTRPVKIQNLSRYKKNGVSLCIPNNDITIVQYYPTRRQYMGWDLNDANKHKPVWRALGISGSDPVPIAERRSGSSSTTSSSTAEAEVQAAPTSWFMLINVHGLIWMSSFLPEGSIWSLSILIDSFQALCVMFEVSLVIIINGLLTGMSIQQQQ